MNFIFLVVMMLGMTLIDAFAPIVVIPVVGGLLIIKLIIDVILGMIDGIFR